jgi:hypothetical protein
MKPLPGNGLRAVALTGLASSLLILNAPTALANGFTQPEGSTFTSFTVRTFHVDAFDKYELEAYAEYGLKDDITLTFKLPFAWLDDEIDGETVTNSGFTDLELGARWRFNDLDAPIATSLQGTVLIPLGYDQNADLPLGPGAVGLEARVPVSGGYQWGERNGFWSLEAAYRQYLDSGVSNEIKLFGEISQDISERFALAGQIEQSIALGGGGSNNPDPEQGTFTKLTGHVWYRATDNLTFVLGGYTHVAGSDGGGLEGKIWYQF